MGARLAAMACKRFYDFETVVPCHYATFGLLDQSADRFVDEMKSNRARVVVPDFGETIEF
jgi:L-ascorbate metabolism protein UlaG (beta-lactamase superfamily)